MNIKLCVKSVSFEAFLILSIIIGILMLCDLNHSVGVYMDTYTLPGSLNYMSVLLNGTPLNSTISISHIYNTKYFYHVNDKPFIPYFWLSILLFAYNLYMIILMMIICLIVPLIYLYKYFTLVSAIGICILIVIMSIKRYQYELRLHNVGVK